jgi:myb proto-oncogene protein
MLSILEKFFICCYILSTNLTNYNWCRWRNSICPVRKGSFTPEEDERLTVAFMLFGPKWNQIAKYVPGRIQSQCRDKYFILFYYYKHFGNTVDFLWFSLVEVLEHSYCRYLNSLDPSLKWGGWTEEEDLRLKAAITKYGYCWSKVAKDVPLRTDSQCLK